MQLYILSAWKNILSNGLPEVDVGPGHQALFTDKMDACAYGQYLVAREGYVDYTLAYQEVWSPGDSRMEFIRNYLDESLTPLPEEF